MKKSIPEYTLGYKPFGDVIFNGVKYRPVVEFENVQSARQWLIGGGGGFEDGEDGIRACTMSATAAIELMDEYVEVCVAKERERCAKIAETCHEAINFVGPTSVIGPAIAVAIRGQNKNG